MKKSMVFLLILATTFTCAIVYGAITVPNEIQQPGTQPREIGNLESPDKCDNCHGGYDTSVEPAHNWRGSMMANAGRDPIFWATLAVAEQDFDGAGDLCIRCHSTAGWLAGRSTPTDGSGLAAGDADGVECDFCHKLTNPDNSDPVLQGLMNPPFEANMIDPEDGILKGYYGSGMSSIWVGSQKLGPYDDAEARHQFAQSNFHRSIDFCGTCHDVSNSAVGDLAPNNGTQIIGVAGLEPGTYSGILDTPSTPSPIEEKAAFNNFPFMYGIVERTFSEYKAGALSRTLINEADANLGFPTELLVPGGAIDAAIQSSLVAGSSGNYADNTDRYFSCQTCHMRPVTGFGCNKKGAPIRTDLPLHDMTGGNYWMPDAIQYLDSQGKLLLGGGLTTVQTTALNDGKTRAMKQLSEAASLAVSEVGGIPTVKIVNLTGHKLISGYPEGRRMWLNIKWYDSNNQLIREDGQYGPVVTITNPVDGSLYEVNSIMDLHDPNTKIYEAHYAMTKEWALKLLDVGYPEGLPLSFDSETGDTDYTLGDLANGSDQYYETFHFVLNNYVAKDNRIPPYGMSYDEAEKRNALPVPADQYGGSPGGSYNHFDEFELSPPDGGVAAYAEISLLYQPTSWEYIQFLWKANTGGNSFLANEGINLLDAWLHTAMAAPYVMASTTWGTAPTPATPTMVISSLSTWSIDKKGNLTTLSDVFKSGDSIGIEAVVNDEEGLPLSGAQVFLDILDDGGTPVSSLQGFTDTSGVAVLKWKTSRRQAAGNYSAEVNNILKSGYEYDAANSTTSATFTIQ
jgi:hypothetical protein